MDDMNQLQELISKVDHPLQTTFQNVHQGYVTENLTRLLEARDWDPSKANQMLNDCLNWRVQNQIDNILSKPIIPADLYRTIRDSQLIGLSGYTREVLIEGLPGFAVGVGRSTFDKASGLPGFAVGVGRSTFDKASETPPSWEDLKKDKLERKAWKRMLHRSKLDIQDTEGDGQSGSSSHGRNEKDRMNEGKDNFVDPKVSNPPISAEKPETWYKKLHAICSNILDKFLRKENRETTNNLLPISTNDLANELREQRAMSFKDFLKSALNISAKERAIILAVLLGMLKILAENSTMASTPQFQFQGGTTANMPQTNITFGEAIFYYSPEIAYISVFIIAYIMTWTMILPLPSGLLICFAVLLICAPSLLFFHLLRNASSTGIHVACGGFNLPVMGFTAVATVGFCLFFALVFLVVVFVLWRYMSRMRPARGQDIEGAEADAMLAWTDI